MHSGCFVSSIDGLLAAQYLDLDPYGSLIDWNEDTQGVSVTERLEIRKIKTIITRKLSVHWPATITIEDSVQHTHYIPD